MAGSDSLPSEELEKMEHQPLLPVEKKLVVGSLVLGGRSLRLSDVDKPGILPGRLKITN